ALRPHLEAGYGVDCGQTGVAADQCLRVGHVLSDVPAAAVGQVPNQDLPDTELRARWFVRVARILLHKAWAAQRGAWTANDEGWEVHRRVRGMPGQLRHRAGDVVQRRLL